MRDFKIGYYIFIFMCVFQMIFAIHTKFAMIVSYGLNIMLATAIYLMLRHKYSSHKKLTDHFMQFEKDISKISNTCTCTVCNMTRNDCDVFVISHHYEFEGGIFTRNIRYCRDNLECQMKALNHEYWESN